MRKARILLPASLLVVLLSLWTGTQLAASAPKPASPAAHSGVTSAEAITSHGPAKRTYIETGYAKVTVRDGASTPIGSPLKVMCPGSGTCDLELDQDIQYSADGSTTEDVGCYAVDGKMIVPSCFSGGQPPGPTATLGWTAQHSVGHGSHEVQFFGYVAGNTQAVDYYTNEVRVYQP